MACFTFPQALQLWIAMESEQTRSSLLIIDTRPYISYNSGHIKGACNMYCPPILKRRFARGGEVHIESMLGCETKNRLLKGEFSTIVVYDHDGSSALPILSSDNTMNNSAIDTSDLNIVFQTLCKLAKGAECFILKGQYAFCFFLDACKLSF